MKFITAVILLITALNFNFTLQTKNKFTTNYKLQTFLQSMEQTKSQARNFLKSLYESVNFLEKTKKMKNKRCGKTRTSRSKRIKAKIKANFLSKTGKTQTKTQKFQRTSSVSTIKKSYRLLSRILETKSETYNQYKYYEFSDVVANIYEAAKKDNGNWVKITTAQAEFNLPNPGGSCGKNKEYFFTKLFF